MKSIVACVVCMLLVQPAFAGDRYYGPGRNVYRYGATVPRYHGPSVNGVPVSGFGPAAGYRNAPRYYAPQRQFYSPGYARDYSPGYYSGPAIGIDAPAAGVGIYGGRGNVRVGRFSFSW